MKSSLTPTLVRTFLFAATGIVMATSIAVAQEQRGGGRPSGPPPEAIEACVDMQEGDTVSFESRRGDTVEGQCKLIEGQLVAVPEGHEKRQRD